MLSYLHHHKELFMRTYEAIPWNNKNNKIPRKELSVNNKKSQNEIAI